MSPSRAGAIAAALLLAACAASEPSAPPAPDVVRIGHEGDLLDTDPSKYKDSVTQSVLSNVFEGLVAVDRDMRLVPALAVGWNAVDDLTWVMELRPGVRFHDGSPVTAAELKAALERARDAPDSAMRSHLATVGEIEASAPDRLVLHTTRRDPLLINRLSYVLLSKDARGPDGSLVPVGTGPYRIVSWERGRSLEARAFDEYWGGRPAIGEARFVTVAPDSDVLDVLRRGGVDVLRYLPDDLRDDVAALPGMRVAWRAGLTTYYLWLDSRPAGRDRNPFADRRVRHALSMALDRAELVARIGGGGVPANQFVEKGIFGYVAGLPPLPHDPERARSLLAEAGWPDGFRATLSFRPGGNAQTMSAAVREMLGAIGVRVDVEERTSAEIVDAWTAGRLPFFYGGWRFESGDAHSFFVDCLETRDDSRSQGSFNPGFSDPALDALIEAHARIVGDANRLRHYEKITRLALEQMPIVPLYTRDNVFAVAQRLQWEPRLDGRLLAAEMSFHAR